MSSTNQLPIQFIQVNRVNTKGGFKSSNFQENEFTFLQQYFDEKGNKTKEIIYSEEGEEEQSIDYAYNENAQLVEEKHHFTFDEIDETTRLEYNNNLLVKRLKEFSYGSIETVEIKYNSDNLPVSVVTKDEEGVEEESEHFEYEGKNLTHYTKQNALIGKETEWWKKYDEKGNVIEEKRWDVNSPAIQTITYDYSKNQEEPDSKVINEKGAIIEAHIKLFDEKDRIIQHEIQQANNGLKKHITTYEYNDDNQLIYLETVNQLGVIERKMSAIYNQKGLLQIEIKSEFEVAYGSINTFTLKYEYTFHN